MTGIVSVGLVLVCAYTALVVTGMLVRAQSGDRLTRSLVFLLLFFAVFFGSYLLLGVAAFATHAPLVRTDAALGVAGLLALASTLLARRTARGELTSPSIGRLPRFDRRAFAIPEVLAAGAILLFVICAAMLAGGFPQGFEVQAYHLPSALNIIGTRTLQPWDSAFLHAYPLNASIFYAFLLQFLPEHVVAASDLLFLAVLVFAVYGIARLASGDRRAALIAATGTATIPVVAFSSFELGADVGGIAFLAIGVYLCFADGLTPLSRAALVGIAAGLACGFKSLHLIATAVLLFALIVPSPTGLSPRWGGQRARLQMFAMFSACWLALAGFWFARNWILYSNPLYPVWMPLFGRLFSWGGAPDVDYASRAATQFEWVRRSSEWFVYPWVEWQAIGENFKHSSGVGAFFAAMVPASFFGAVVTLLLKRSVQSRRVLVTLVAGAGVILVSWWILGDRQPRYAMGALVFACPLVAWAIASSTGAARRLFESVAAVSIAVMLLVIGAMEAAGFGANVLYSHGSVRNRFYEYPIAIDSLPAGSTILNLGGRPWHYPLAGSRLDNRVISLPQATRMLMGKSELLPPPRIVLHHDALKRAGVTHVFSDGAQLTPDSCVSLSELGRMDKNPVNGVALAEPRILFAVRYCDSENADSYSVGKR
jgi:hypothetical protein